MLNFKYTGNAYFDCTNDPRPSIVDLSVSFIQSNRRYKDVALELIFTCTSLFATKHKTTIIMTGIRFTTKAVHGSICGNAV